MSSAMITYDRPHRKTLDVLNGLLLEGNLPERIYAIPFVPRKPRTPLFSHRPGQDFGPQSQDFAERHGIAYIKLDDIRDLPDQDDLILMMAGVLIPEETLGKQKILNTHPGLIPAVKGLDAFKWTILEMQPLGNTLHYIDARVDEGELLCHIPTPVYASDTLESLALRHYQNEMDMTIRYPHYIDKATILTDLPDGIPHKRMSTEKEKEMMAAFDGYKDRFAS